jgi:4-cresol dehydrogenase (hydroxylating)
LANIDRAIGEWRSTLGDDSVDANPETKARYARSTAPSGTEPSCVLYPQSTEHVQDIVRTASENGVVLYPISRGRNWGYGDACAPTDGTAIVDLGRMNRILEVNEELCYAVVEPGVTQGQFHQYLTDHHPNLWFDSTGAGLEASLVGNTLDRGFGHTRYADHFATACGLEIVLASGEAVRTGHWHYDHAKTAHVYRYGTGPFLDGLFGQSNLGIVTRMGLWLMPKPASFTTFYLRMPDDAHLEQAIDRIRPLRLDGTITAALHLANDMRIISARDRYPWGDTDNVTPMPNALREKIRSDNGIGQWNVAGALSGSAGQVRASSRALKKALGPLSRYLTFVPERRLIAAERVTAKLKPLGIATWLYELAVNIRPNFDLAKGVPSNEPLFGSRWRLREEPNTDSPDPLDANVGLMWLSPVLPMTGKDARAVMDIAAPILAAHTFDPLVTFTMINERAMIAILNVVFDKRVPEDCDNAAAGYAKVSKALFDAGYPPYRTGPSGMNLLHSPNDPFWGVASQIKRALDPNDIIARGRYIPPLDS